MACDAVEPRGRLARNMAAHATSSGHGVGHSSESVHPDRGPRSAEAERREDGRESAHAGDSPHGAHQVGLGLQVSGGGGVGFLLRLEHFDDHLDAVEGCQKGGAKFA